MWVSDCCFTPDEIFFSHLMERTSYIQWYEGPSWSWSYGSWIYNYLCNEYLSPLTLWVRILLRWGVLDTTLCDEVCQWLSLSFCCCSLFSSCRHVPFIWRCFPLALLCYVARRLIALVLHLSPKHATFERKKVHDWAHFTLAIYLMKFVSDLRQVRGFPHQ